MMKKIMLLILSSLMLLFCGKIDEVSNKDSGNKNSGTNETYKIGITQIATHPSLDLVKQGFKKAFEEAGIKANFDEKNAEGTIANATLIANGYKTDKKDLVLGIGTPSAQALVNTITDIPVLFSAVTDPESAKLLNKNVTGTSDRLDNVGEQLDLLLKLKPEIKKIAVLYNPSEQNSVVQVKEIEAKAKEKNLIVMLQGVSSLSELPQATKNALVEKWMTRRALEVRFIDRASIKQKEDYQQMEEAEQLAYLKRKFAEKIKQTERAELQEGQILPAQYADKLPQWQPENRKTPFSGCLNTEFKA